MKRYRNIALGFLGYLIFGIAVVYKTGGIGNLFFVWNVFLAFLPLLFVGLLQKHLAGVKKSKWLIALLSVLWLLFFPNAPYMVTDLIYFGDTSYLIQNGYAHSYTTDIVAWVKLVYLGVGVLFGSILGLQSLLEMHWVIRRYIGKKTAGGAVLATCLLSGFAIYIGRMLRFNSWDILRPVALMTRLWNEINSFTVAFSLLFAFYILGSYLLFYAVVNIGGHNRETH